MITIDVAKHFSKTPGPRYIFEGAYSGEAFRTSILYPAVRFALDSGEQLTVILDGACGYGTSFLEESFAGLIRENGLSLCDLEKTLLIISGEMPEYIDEICSYMQDAWNHSQASYR